MKRIRDLFSDESGQDLIEYTLMVAVIALTSAALFASAGNDVSRIWTTANSQLTNSAPDCTHGDGDRTTGGCPDGGGH